MIDAYHGRAASNYDTRWRTFTARMLTPVVDLAQARLSPQARILDVGCGTGVLLARFLAQQPALVVMGTDQSVDMLAQTRLRLGTQAQVAEWDLDRPPPQPVVATAPFDLITCTNVLHYLHAPVHTIQQLGQLLTPHGQLVLADFIRHGWWWPLFEVLLHGVDRAHHQTLTSQQLTQLVHDGGLTSQTVQPIVVNHLWHGTVVLGER